MALLDGTTGNAYYNSSDLGNYQFTSLQDVINQFILSYVGEERVISKVKRPEVVFHAQRGLQELSFDTFKSTKAYEIVVPSNLQMILPHDYVNYVKLSWSDAGGIEHVLYPAIKTSNPLSIDQEADGDYIFQTDEELVENGDYSVDLSNSNGKKALLQNKALQQVLLQVAQVLIKLQVVR